MFIKNSTDKKSFFQTMFHSFIAISLLTSLTLTAFLSLNYIKSSIYIVKKYNQDLLLQTNYTINQMNEQVDLLAELLSSNSYVTSFFEEEQYHDLSNHLTNFTLDKQLSIVPYIESIYLYNASANAFYSSKTGEIQPLSSFPDKNAAELVINPDFKLSCYPISVIENSNNDEITTISYYMFDPNTANDTQKNAIVVNVLPSFLANSINSINELNSGTDTSFIVMDQNGNILCSVLSPLLAALPDLSSNMKAMVSDISTESPIVKIEQLQYLKSITKNNQNNWLLINLIPIKVLLHDILLSSIIGTSIMLLVMFLCFMLCVYLTKQLNSPIKAITDIVKGKDNVSTSVLQKTAEFDSILSSFEALQEQNRQFEELKQKTVYSARQNYLNRLLSGDKSLSKEEMPETLQHLELSYLFEHSLCMIMFKIDHYRNICEKNSSNELWALRFGILNILEETASLCFPCDALSRENDRFILLLDCKEGRITKNLSRTIEKIIVKIQANVKHSMNLTLTATYSPFFHGLERLPNITFHLEDSLLMKMKYGHEALISPHKVDEMDSDPFPFPDTDLEQLITFINNGQSNVSVTSCKQIMSQLYSYGYDEIFSGTIHLLYGIYLGVQKKYPHLKEACTLLLKEYLSKLQGAEITDDLSDLMEEFIRNICQTTAALSAVNVPDNAIVNRVLQMIEQEYSNPSLCLSYLADEIGLTPNYIGKLFKATLQKSVSQYILDYRMDTLGKYLKESTLPLDTLLNKVGMEKTNYFYTQFKKHFGLSLMEYRLTQKT